MDITPEHADLLTQAAAAVGKKYARKYPSLEWEDIASEVQSRILTDWERISGKLQMAGDYGKSEYEVLHFLLSEKAKVHCEKQHYQYMVEHPHALIYTPKEVRALLKEYYYDPDVYATPAKDDHLGDAVEAKSVWVNLSDLNRALRRVDNRTHDTVLAAFGPADLELPEPDRRRVTDAVTKVTEELNRHLNTGRGSHEGPGARQAISNSSAVYQTHASDESVYNRLENAA
ncbi:hypothetical protein [Nonomuraea jabiensis]|uniref:hypothetical protein n=1 Tax=Nonomuraea jabiensis TaxID=882448 RepID=UPI003D72ED7D